MSDEVVNENVNGLSSTAATTTTIDIIRISVGSSNPAKIRAAEQAIRRCLSSSTHKQQQQQIELNIEGFDVESGVSDQPYGDEETILGAKTRALCAYKEYRIKYKCKPHISIGMEGGLEWFEKKQKTINVDDNNKKDDNNIKSNNDNLFCMAWMAIYGQREGIVIDAFSSNDVTYHFGDKKPIFGLAKSSMFALPPGLANLVKEGMELSTADDQFFGRVSSKKGSGTVGKLTNDIIDRSAYYEHAIILAMNPWIRPDLYPNGLE